MSRGKLGVVVNFLEITIILEILDNKKILVIFNINLGPLTQTVEYQPFKLGVAGSSPARPIKRSPHRLARSRTPAFHAGDRGSNPLGGVFFQMSKPLAIVLLSAGMDSAVCASIASINYSLAFLHIQYGQRTAKKELECFYKLCNYYKPQKIFVAEAYFLKTIGASSLTNDTLPIPEEDEEGIPSTYVPFRNGIFLSIATAWAESLGVKKIFIGVNQIDFSGYPDCTESFIRAFNLAILEGTKPDTKIQIETPLINLRKKEIVEKGISLGTPFHLTWSCYKENEIACGKCSSCKLRMKAFREAGTIDPIPYRNKQ